MKGRSISLRKPSAERSEARSIIEQENEGPQKKLVLDLPLRLHKQLKQAALDRGITMRAIVIEWLEGMKQ